jgi:hypothetical protein
MAGLDPAIHHEKSCRVGKGAQRRAHRYLQTVIGMVGTLRFAHPTILAGNDSGD